MAESNRSIPSSSPSRFVLPSSPHENARRIDPARENYFSWFTHALRYGLISRPALAGPSHQFARQRHRQFEVAVFQVECRDKALSLPPIRGADLLHKKEMATRLSFTSGIYLKTEASVNVEAGNVFGPFRP